MRESYTPVLIAGGSLVGLSSAVFLARQGVSCMLVERHPGTSVHPRAVGYYPRTMELLRQAGLEERALKAAAGFASHRTRAGVESLAGATRFSRTEMDEDDLGAVTPCRLLLLTQDRLEPLLREEAEHLGADLRFATTLTSFTQDRTGVDAELFDEQTGRTWRMRSDYLIGADGPRSRVREALGISRTGKGVLSRHVSIAFHADLAAVLDGRRFSVVHVENDQVRGILVHDDTLREGTLIVGYDPERGESLDDFTDQRCERLVRAAIGVADIDVRIRSRFPWDMAESTATRYVDARVLLAGDAAHVIPPTGGYGANTGIADAHNLAWKLAAVLAGTAGPELLDTYDSERRPVGAFAAAQGALQLAVRSGTATAEQRAAAFDAQVVTMGYAYPAPGDPVPFALDPAERTAEPGTRAPHVWLPGDGGQTSTLDLVGTGFTLLTAGDGERWTTAARAAAAVTGVPVEAHAIDPGTPGFTGRYGLDPGGAALIRPDGFVARRFPAGSGDPARELTAAIRNVLFPDSPPARERVPDRAPASREETA
ncbi:FAD-dependent oxidoreductase [Actinoplanes ianthinogenes]|uniref:FAD-dependent oxidoreductase n=1 Tax=Actinoplanes ianthinogenes TaxID=122358 RepID=A0ABM7M8N7_9ACTN|nr:FAD-dependent monooxygenase [Actinoplanes ianthinogenes]BCJ47990.1 FAD-dependent oxidoreductase [Actinoplanes ianthinogenes]GGR05612.1 FAD-dependent oxidoreductase [Actinoplanes ianthinogenes]